MSKKQRSWLSPLDILAAQEGEYSIVHETIPAGSSVPFCTWRNKILGGQKGPNALVYDTATRWHKLKGPTGTWMTDLPVEQRQMEECLKGLKGRILVGGLGLGLAAHILNQRKAVTHVDVVELAPEVIKLVGPWINSRWQPKGKDRGWLVNIIQGELLTYLKNYQGRPYDYAFFDIWQNDNEQTFFTTVVPLYQASEGKVKHPPINWNEDVMRGQLLFSIQNRLLFLSEEAQQKLPDAKRFLEQPPWEPGETIWQQWAVPFFKWWREAKPSQEQTQYMAKLYSKLYGSWGWEETWEELSASLS